ncbi:MAG: GNAT family N-acetyltransferase [Victivallales bacterium]|nr:GNAT family N-acetyltransferase [Victivallales bacterium]
MTGYKLREMVPADRLAVADLICLSTNCWYQAHGHSLIFADGPVTTELHFDLYQTLEGSSGLVVEDTRSGAIIGSCFQHIRPTHVSLGIMNVHPNHFGRGVARTLLNAIIDTAKREGKPLRLVSSAMNLDSYSLYTRAGFVPRHAYQDMFLAVPEDGLDACVPNLHLVRPATPADVPAMAAVELAVSGIRRDSDYRHFIENPDGIWHVSVFESAPGRLEGFLVSCGHSGVNMIGPGVMCEDEVTAALLFTELNQHRGRTPVFLLPVERNELVRQVYSWGGRNCEMHFSQVLGDFTPFQGINMPTFLPETG